MQAARAASGNRLLLRTSLSEIDRLAAWVDGVASEGLTPDMAFAVQLCLEEAVANIVMYGGTAEDAQISLEFATNRGGTTVVIEDGGRPFDPTALPPRVKPVSLEETRIGELGVHLMRHYSSSMLYERLGERNRLTLTFGPTSSPNRT